MAKQSQINRNKKREKMVAQYMIGPISTPPVVRTMSTQHFASMQAGSFEMLTR